MDPDIKKIKKAIQHLGKAIHILLTQIEEDCVTSRAVSDINDIQRRLTEDVLKREQR